MMKIEYSDARDTVGGIVDDSDIQILTELGLTVLGPCDRTYDCEMYALRISDGISSDTSIDEMVDAICDKTINGDTPENYNEVQSHCLQEGDLVIYFVKEKGKNELTHFGRVADDGQIISKWGCGGPLVKHPIELVPYCYGDIVKFYRKIKET